jgi:hypothetical protein
MKWAYALAVASMSVACSAGATGADTSTPAAGEPAVAAAAPRAPEPAARRAPKPAARREVTVPSGTMLTLDLATALASDTSQVEDTVRATLREAVKAGGQTVLPAGTELVGTVTAVERPGRVKGRAKLAYQFSSLQHNGARYEIRTEAIAHEGEATKSEDATKIGVGAGAGAVIGGLLGGGDGAAKGAAIGGGAGTGVVLATRGKDLRLGPGTNVTTHLTSPLRVAVKG